MVSENLNDVSVKLKANVYFEGGVVSHSLTSKTGARQTIGTIRPGEYHFNTDAPERMDIISGTCQVKLAGQSSWTPYAAGSSFRVPGKSGFDIQVGSGLTEYLCSFE